MNTVEKIEIADVMCEFFQAAIHNILYTRGLYPENIFARRNIYGIIVHQSEHPLLNEYISESLKAAHFHTKNGELRKLLVCVKSGRKVMESYVFEVLQLVNRFKNDGDVLKLKDNLRSLCLKLGTSNVYLDKLPGNAEFSIELHTSEYSAVAFNENNQYSDFPWAQVCPQKQNPPEIIPIHTIDTENVVTQFYIEKYS